MDRGRPGFPQDFKCPVVLRNVLAAIVDFAYGSITLFALASQLCSTIDSGPLCCTPYNPFGDYSPKVWAIPFSLALLRESLRFLFLQVLRFFNSLRSLSFRNDLMVGFPHSEIHGSKVVRHLTVAFRSHTTSFIASYCQGIHRIPLVA